MEINGTRIYLEDPPNTQLHVCIDGSRFLLSKQAGISDFPIFSWFNKKYNQLKKKRQTNKTHKIITSQGKLRKTIKFKYTNLKGVEKLREVDPYEIKNGFLWGAEHSSPKNIRRFFVSKMQNVEPGNQKFSPQWNVKLAGIGAAIKKIYRTPSVLRGAEAVVGGLGGGLYGAAESYGEPKHQKYENILKDAVTGAILAGMGSFFYRNVIVPKAIKRRSQELMTGRTYKINNAGEFAGRYPKNSPESASTVYRRSIINIGNNPEEKKDMIFQIRRDMARKLLIKNEKLYSDAAIGKKPSPGVRSAFIEGYYGRGRYKNSADRMHWNAKKEQAYIDGQNLGQDLLEKYTKSIKANADNTFANEFHDANVLVHRLSDLPMIEKIMKRNQKRLFGVW